jgi:hypothetical protein
MFALNAAAFMNACEPSHALSKSPRRMSPDGQCSTRRVNWASGCGEMRWPSTIEMQAVCAHCHRLCAACVPWLGMRRCIACLPSAAADSHACFTHPSQNGEIFRAVAYYRVCGVRSILPEKSKARKQAPHPKPSHGSGRPMQQQHSVWAKHGSQARARVRQEHAPRPNSAVQKCRPVRERHTRRGIWCTHRRRHTRYMFTTLAEFHAPMSALNAVAPLSACGPSHTLSQSPRRIRPKLRWSI